MPNDTRDNNGKFAGARLPEDVRKRKTEYEKRRRTNDPAYKKSENERVRKYHYIRSYGITWEETTEMRMSQGNACGCCRMPFPDSAKGGDFNVDHDHDTGEVRGILCRSCNVGLALFGDGEAGLNRAIAYLRGDRISPAGFSKRTKVRARRGKDRVNNV